MENHRILRSFSVFLLVLLSLPFPVSAYSDDTTHPALTQEIVKFYNSKYPSRTFSRADSELIIQGSINEDIDTRFFNHFYDPVNNQGLSLPVVGTWPSSKQWGVDTEFQRGWEQGNIEDYFSGSEDFSWDRSIYEYVWGDRNRGLLGLGHILHLLEDATVPDHTRNDPHPPVSDFGSPYEAWTKQFVRGNIKIDGLAGKEPVLFSSLEEYFDSIARYSNGNFFSKDTIFDTTYQKPIQEFSRIENLKDGPDTFLYGRDSYGDIYRLAMSKTKIGERAPEYFVEDRNNLVLSDYWRLLSRQAVLHGAGAVKLFLDEAEEERRTQVLKNRNTNFLAKVIAETGDFLFGTTPPAPASVNLVFVGPPAPQIVQVPIQIPIPKNTPLPVVAVPPVIQTIVSQIAPSPQLVAPSPVQAILPPAIQTPPPVPEFSIIPGFGGGFVPLPAASASVAESSGGGGGASSAPAPSPDTEAPDLTFSIPTCDASLASGSCLLATSTLRLVWSSSALDLDSYELSHNGAIATTTRDLEFSAVLALGENVFSLTARDAAGNVSSPVVRTVSLAASPLVINEINWAGSRASSADRWIELLNTTSATLDLSRMVLHSLDYPGFYVPLSGTIPPNGFYLIESLDSAVSDSPADLVFPFGSAISPSGDRLVLAYKADGHATSTLDETFSCANWCGKGTRNPTQVFSMERRDPGVSGSTSDNWSSNVELIITGRDSMGNPIQATPRAQNSVTYLVNNGNDIASNLTLTKVKSPYLLSRMQAVAPSAVLTIEPGVVVKSGPQGGLAVSGQIQAAGADSEPIVFTALSDDEYGGDMNLDGGATLPSSGAWKSVAFVNGSEGSVLDHVRIRYGGGDALEKANLSAINASFTMSNSVSEFARERGVSLGFSTSTITLSLFKGMPLCGASLASFGSSAFERNTFEENAKGFCASANASGRVENNMFTGNSSRAFEIFSPANLLVSGNTGSGNGTNGIVLTGNLAVLGATSTYNRNTLLPYVVGSGGTNLFPGAAAVFGPGATLKIRGMLGNTGGNLEMRGTPEEPILATSISDDSDGSDTENDGPTEGVRFSNSGIRMNSTSYSNIENARFQFFPVALRYSASSPAVMKNISFDAVSNSYILDRDGSGERTLDDRIENVAFGP